MVDEPMKVLNCRVPESTRDLVAKAAELAGSANMSVWMREALEAGARTEIAAAEARHRTVEASSGQQQGLHQSRLGLRVLSSPSCVHPTTARIQNVESESCGICGTITRWKV